MSEEPPRKAPRKMKNKDYKETTSLSPEEIHPSDNKEVEEMSMTTDLQQGEMNLLNNTEVEEMPQTINVEQQSKRKKHTFRFCSDNKTYAVSCDTSQTVLNALDTSQAFKQLKEKSKQKELVIKRQKEAWEITGAAVNADFPCCLIQKDEILNVDFIQIREHKKWNQEQKANKSLPLADDPESLVTFNIKTKGGGELKRLMKNMELGLEVEDVCVYAFKDETLESALRRDGRFIEEIFKRNCVFLDLGTNTMYELSNCTEHINRKCFQLNVMSTNTQLDGQYDKGATKIKCKANLVGSEKNKDKDGKTTKSESHLIPCENIPKSEEMAGILHAQFKEMKYQLKQLMNDSEIQQFFRAEYDKSRYSFSEVKKVKIIMGYSDSVCKIKVGNTAKGTGFVLFKRFILTNLHVFREYDLTTVNLADFTAVFNNEDQKEKCIQNEDQKEKCIQNEDQKELEKCIPIKNFSSYFKGKDDKGNHLDYALLELNSDDDMVKYPQLLKHYRHKTPDNRSEICIVGHPDGGVKKMDPCFVIGGDNRIAAGNKHASKNVKYYHVMSQRSLEEKWDFHKNQITYNSCFFHGSSGSPVFDVNCKLIGIHTGGYVYEEEGGVERSVMEYAYAMQPILDNIKAQARIKGMQDILNILEDKSNGGNVSSSDEQNQADVEMENRDEGTDSNE